MDFASGVEKALIFFGKSKQNFQGMLTALRQGRGDISDRSENSAGRLGRLKPSRLESGGQFPPWDAWDGVKKLFLY